MKKDINRITFFNFLSILLLQGIAMISAPLFSRLLGTSGYGSLASFTAWSNMACIILSLQSNETIVNARQEYDEQAQPGYQSSIMALSILGFLVSFVWEQCRMWINIRCVIDWNARYLHRMC